jgi:hypothetical protein
VFIVDLTKVLAAPVLGAILFTFLAQATAPNRSEASMRATPFADFVPEGAALANDHFIAGKANVPLFVSRFERAQINRILGTDEPAAFQAAFIAHARAVGAELVGHAGAKYPPLPQIRTWENTTLALGAYAQGALAEFTFSSRTPVVVGGQTFKWRISFQVTDGPCHFLFSECQPVHDS